MIKVKIETPRLASMTIKVENKNKKFKVNKFKQRVIVIRKIKSIIISKNIKIIIIWYQLFNKANKKIKMQREEINNNPSKNKGSYIKIKITGNIKSMKIFLWVIFVGH